MLKRTIYQTVTTRPCFIKFSVIFTFRGITAAVLVTFFAQPLVAQAVQQDEKPPVTLVLAQDDSVDILRQIFDYTRLRPEAPFPLLAAPEPGPLELAEGLRLLPNEVAPRLTIPRLLILSQAAGEQADAAMLALIRRCLLEGGTVWVIGKAISQPLVELPLDPGQEIRLLEVNALAAMLYARND